MEKIIYQSRIKIFILAFLGAPLMVTLGIWLYLDPYSNQNLPPIINQWLGIIVAVGSIIAFLRAVPQLLKKNIGLKIDDEKITIYSPQGKESISIEWKHVTKISTEMMAKNNFVILHVDDLNAVRKPKGSFQKIYSNLQLTSAGNKVPISNQFLKIKLPALHRLLEEQFDAYKTTLKKRLKE